MQELIERIRQHNGTIVCYTTIDGEAKTKEVAFEHIVTPSITSEKRLAELPEMGGLRAFYSAIGSLSLYHVPESEEVGVYIASPEQWPDLESALSSWLRELSEEDWSKEDQDWLDGCLIIGEEPYMDNHYLMRMGGEDAGKVYCFTHDGMEIDEIAESLPAFVEYFLNLNDRVAAWLSYGMRFSKQGESTQWIIQSMRDNCGNTARLDVYR